MEIRTMASFLSPQHRGRRPSDRRRTAVRPELQSLESRSLLSGYEQLNLVGYQPGMARRTDPNLNGWGMAHAPDGPFCVANNGTGTATFYSADGKVLPLVITIPTAHGQPLGPIGSPTGVVYNPTSDFVISENGRSAPARFIFDTFDGLICGWNPAVDPTHAIIMVDNSQEGPAPLVPAFYTGLELAKNSHGQNVLYAVDDGTNNKIDMFDGHLHSLGSFTDPTINPQVETVFQAEDIGGKLFVTITQLAAPFGGTVDIFDTDGHLLKQGFISNAPNQGPLDAPWAMVLAPGDFGKFSNDLLIGNVEGAGNINAFDPRTGAFLGTLAMPDGTPIAITGLWDLTFGGGDRANGERNELFFTAGFTLEAPLDNGLFGVIRAASDHGGGQGAGGDGEDAMAARGTIVRLAPPPASATGPQATAYGWLIDAAPPGGGVLTTLVHHVKNNKANGEAVLET
jgi:uncharacterized protein (TIGR03118 family)